MKVGARALVLAGALYATQAVAAGMKGNDLLDLCNVAPGACSYYVDGVIDEALFFEARILAEAIVSGANAKGAKMRKADFCTPRGATMDQLRDVVVKFIINNPERRHYYAVDLVAQGLGNAFPCP